MYDKLLLAVQGLFQSRVEIWCGSKIYRKGILTNLRNKNSYIIIQLKDDRGNTKTVNIPFPYDYTVTGTSVVFDYKLETLAGGNTGLLSYVKTVHCPKKSRLYDTILTIKEIKQ